MGEWYLGVRGRRLSYLSARWVYTGDEVIINEKCEIFVVDRLKVHANSDGTRTTSDLLLGNHESPRVPSCPC